MPPLASWYQGRDGIATWARLSPMSGDWRWRTVRTHANGQPALAFYSWDEATQAYLPFALNVLTLRGSQISDVTAFIVRSIESPEAEAYERFPEQPADQRRVTDFFERFGLPAQLD
jgi:RNA polymerase sigma-70 factor (ECF subfamily)